MSFPQFPDRSGKEETMKNTRTERPTQPEASRRDLEDPDLGRRALQWPTSRHSHKLADQRSTGAWDHERGNAPGRRRSLVTAMRSSPRQRRTAAESIITGLMIPTRPGSRRGTARARCVS